RGLTPNNLANGGGVEDRSFVGVRAGSDPNVRAAEISTRRPSAPCRCARAADSASSDTSRPPRPWLPSSSPRRQAGGSAAPLIRPPPPQSVRDPLSVAP